VRRPGEDIEIRFTGTRPGEKLFEELSITGEDVSRTSHSKIGIIKKRPEDFNRVCQGIKELLEIADTVSADRIREHLKKIVPEFEPADIIQVVAPAVSKQAEDQSEVAESPVTGQPSVRPA